MKEAISRREVHNEVMKLYSGERDTWWVLGSLCIRIQVCGLGALSFQLWGRKFY